MRQVLDQTEDLNCPTSQRLSCPMSRLPRPPSSDDLSRRFYSPLTKRCFKHNRQSNSASESSGSLGFITGIKSATISLASASIARRKQNRSSTASADPRPSIDEIIDDAGRLRSRKRREKLEELIKTEESYVADLRALANVGPSKPVRLLLLVGVC